MQSRTIILTLITALIACPLWCTSGVAACCDDDLALFQTSSSQLDGNLCKTCCCEQPTQDSNDCRPKNDSSNSEKPCQGICGGAVVEKPVESNNTDHTTLLLLDTLNWVSVDSLSSTEIFTKSHSGHISGRFLRTLHMSFLC